MHRTNRASTDGDFMEKSNMKKRAHPPVMPKGRPAALDRPKAKNLTEAKRQAERILKDK